MRCSARDENNNKRLNVRTVFVRAQNPRSAWKRQLETLTGTRLYVRCMQLDGGGSEKGYSLFLKASLVCSMVNTSSPGPGGSDSGLTNGYGFRPSNGAIACGLRWSWMCRQSELLN